VAHFAAESMVDRSVLDPQTFLDVNVLGTGSVLEAARDARVRRFLHISTPEVYGQRVETAARESDAFAPRNVYAASKAAAEMVVSAYVHSFRVPILITRGSSAIGPRQHPEKVTPRLITSALQNQSLPVYGDGSAVRDFVHVSDLNRANDLVLRRGEVGTAYNVATGEARTIRDLAYGIVDRLGKPRSLVAFTDDRVAHDRHYWMDSSRLTSLGWSPQYTFEPALDDTVRWYAGHRAWWLAKVESPDFQRYLSRSAEARAWHATRSGA
jgi:dTDP-glucose 4,6-dehydratase